jgi:DNA-binding LacI/PurR family transcriptional regulator/DNA-binding transcriptional regulator YhcF (GntR family)
LIKLILHGEFALATEEKNPAVQKAFDDIRKNLEAGVWKKGDRLPPVRVLTAAIRVSRGSLLKAIALLKAEGFLSGFERGHLVAGVPEPERTAVAGETNAVWYCKRMALEKDILSGMFAQQGRLPSIKELRARYGTCFTTMRKILRSMVADGVVRLRGKSYEFHDLRHRAGDRRIVYLTHSFPAPQRSALNPEEYRVIDLLERECFRRELVLDIAEVDCNDPRAVSRAVTGSLFDKPAFGYVFDTWWFPDEGFRKGHLDLLERLARLKKPVAVLDELGDFVLPTAFSANRFIQVFRIEGKSSGSAVAQHLLGLGHRCIAYISHAPDALWSQLRHQGIVEQFSKAGYEGNVRAFDFAQTYNLLPLIALVSGFGDDVIKRILSIDHTERQAGELYRALLHLRGSRRARTFDKADIIALRKIVAPLGDAARGTSEKSALAVVCRAVLRKANAQISKMLAAPIFEQAHARREITGWICASDVLAFMALRYLRDRGVDVPYHLSLAGFDNLPMETLEYRLTSFDFNAAGFMYRMLEFITRPPVPRGLYRHSPIEVPGTLMIRGTTAVPRAKG